MEGEEPTIKGVTKNMLYDYLSLEGYYLPPEKDVTLKFLKVILNVFILFILRKL